MSTFQCLPGTNRAIQTKARVTKNGTISVRPTTPNIRVPIQRVKAFTKNHLQNSTVRRLNNHRSQQREQNDCKLGDHHHLAEFDDDGNQEPDYDISDGDDDVELLTFIRQMKNERALRAHGNWFVMPQKVLTRKRKLSPKHFCHTRILPDSVICTCKSFKEMIPLKLKCLHVKFIEFLIMQSVDLNNTIHPSVLTDYEPPPSHQLLL